MTPEYLHSRVFRGLLAQATVDEMTERGLLLAVDAPDQRGDLVNALAERFSARVVRSARKMVPVYATYFAFENSVREFVAEAMQDAHGDNWWEKVPQKIRSNVDSRKKQLEKHKWYKYQPPSNVSQLFFGDLSNIMTDQWATFESFFPNQEWLRVRLSELEMSRNVIAHANELADEEILRLDRYLTDWLSQVPT